MAVREDAEALIAKGHPAMSIYQQFKAAGKISMSYRAFHRHLKGAPKKARQSAPPEKPTPPLSVQRKAPAPAVAEAQKPEAASVPPSRAPRRIGGAPAVDVWKNAAPSVESLIKKHEEA
ncbi:MAG: hypothetical protein HDQ89_02160 [Desulfovibrio sp.]|nr:hypothetical protein [Desulfovibrio sp.]